MAFGKVRLVQQLWLLKQLVPLTSGPHLSYTHRKRGEKREKKKKTGARRRPRRRRGVSLGVGLSGEGGAASSSAAASATAADARAAKEASAATEEEADARGVDLGGPAVAGGKRGWRRSQTRGSRSPRRRRWRA